MKWLTLTEIGRRARSKKGALEVSYEHWCQLYQATAKELRQAYANDKVSIDCTHCGLCRYHLSGGCLTCPLFKADGTCVAFSDNLYSIARQKFLGSDWRAWKRAAKALRDKLKELMDSN